MFKRNGFTLKRKGFTILELIVVMAVILVLSSFLVPKFNGYREKALKVKAIDTGRQIYTAAFVSRMESTDVYSEDSIKDAAKELVGVENITVANSGKDNIDINYIVDKKEYTLEVKDDSYAIKEKSGSQIYPTIAT